MLSRSIPSISCLKKASTTVYVSASHRPYVVHVRRRRHHLRLAAVEDERALVVVAHDASQSVGRLALERLVHQSSSLHTVRQYAHNRRRRERQRGVVRRWQTLMRVAQHHRVHQQSSRLLLPLHLHRSARPVVERILLFRRAQHQSVLLRGVRDQRIQGAHVLQQLLLQRLRVLPLLLVELPQAARHVLSVMSPLLHPHGVSCGTNSSMMTGESACMSSSMSELS